MADGRIAKAWLAGGAVTLIAMLGLARYVDWRSGEVVKAFAAPIRAGGASPAWLGPDFPGSGVLDVTPAIAPLFPIGSDLRAAETRLQKEGFRIHVDTNPPAVEGRSISASRECGPGAPGFQATCIVALEHHRGKVTKVRALADEPQGS